MQFNLFDLIDPEPLYPQYISFICIALYCCAVILCFPLWASIKLRFGDNEDKKYLINKIIGMYIGFWGINRIFLCNIEVFLFLISSALWIPEIILNFLYATETKLPAFLIFPLTFLQLSLVVLY